MSQFQGSIFKSLVLTLVLTAGAANASVLGDHGPLVSDETGNWKEFRTKDDDELISDSADDSSCRIKTTSNLRQLMFEHFRYYADHSKSKIGETEIARFAKVLGMAPYESSGASAAVTDMRSRGSNETLRYFRGDNPRNDPEDEPGSHSSLASIDKLMKLQNVKFDKQTNFGLLQMSADRLAMSGSKDLAAKMIVDMKTLYRSHPEEVIERCGTHHMFKDDAADIRKAFDKIQACEVGYQTKEKVQCFGRWASLCPNYNVTLALIAPPAYFATKKKAPLCAKTFRKILKTGRADGGKVLTPKKKVTPASEVPAAVPTSIPSPTSGVPGFEGAWMRMPTGGIGSFGAVPMTDEELDEASISELFDDGSYGF